MLLLKKKRRAVVWIVDRLHAGRVATIDKSSSRARWSPFNATLYHRGFGPAHERPNIDRSITRGNFRDAIEIACSPLRRR